MSRERDKRKAELVRQIQQQRLDLSAGKTSFLVSIARYDRSWLTLISLRRYVAIGSGLMAIWSVRHPRTLTRWTRRALGLWSSWRMIRKFLPRR